MTARKENHKKIINNNYNKIRKSFGKLPEITELSNLIEIQTNSYKAFLQEDVPANKREKVGLESVLRGIFPIHDFSENSELQYIEYILGDPKNDVKECLRKSSTYSFSLRLKVRLIVYETDEITGVKSVKDIREEDVYVGELPCMTEKGTFVVNGTERVVVSQMHRSPGVFFSHDNGASHSSGKFLFFARIIPFRGSWMDFEFDVKDILNVRIDRKRKLPVTTLLKTLYNNDTEEKIKNLKEGESLSLDEVEGLNNEDIIRYYYSIANYTNVSGKWKVAISDIFKKGYAVTEDVLDDKDNVIIQSGKKITNGILKSLDKKNIKYAYFSSAKMIGKSLCSDLVDSESGEIFASSGDPLTEELIEIISKNKITNLEIVVCDEVNVGPWLLNTIIADKSNTREEALIDIQKIIRPGELPSYEAAESLLHGLFYDESRYDLSAVGRVKINSRLGLKTEDDSSRIVMKEDILEIVKVLLELKDGRGNVDDIDHLGNRRVRSVGELLENQYRLGVIRMERSIKERLSSADLEVAMPRDIINAKPIIAAVREFFGSSQLSQFMDQTNPLAEITHKRRLSALGPGGLTRERAGFEVRDVHATHYGRICPIETPEGPNIGLINSLATYAKVNRYGFIETPYRKVIDGKVTNEVEYLSANEEEKYVIAQANAPLKNNNFEETFISCRYSGEYILSKDTEIHYMDVSPKQVVSVAASLIPFLENDDANRALMGANMQRQAVPLLKPDAPLVGTGMESKVAIDSYSSVVAKNDGIIDQVDATTIVVRRTGDIKENEMDVDIYRLNKFQRSNQNSCINQRPLVTVGADIKKGQIIADGPSTEKGEIALGKNVLVAFMPWNGYNYEDSILISEKIVSDDVFTSIHIEEVEIEARDTKLGEEEITRDIPNVGEDALRNLDESGIVYVGAEVKAGDILVGRVTPKGETPMTPEEKLLRAIFGDKASEVRDSSLRVKPGGHGIVVDVRVFNRRGVEKDERSLGIEREEIEELEKYKEVEKNIFEKSLKARFVDFIKGQNIVSAAQGVNTGIGIYEELDKLSLKKLMSISVKDKKINESLNSLFKQHEETISKINERFNDRVEKLYKGDELLPGVMKVIKVFIAQKRKLQPGDKMAGRHGNKGVVSKVVPVEDLPYLEDGTPVDIVLNPLGVPSRMNIGQILETHLGWASAKLGKQVKDSLNAYKVKANIEEVKSTLDYVYDDKDISKVISGLEKEDVLELANNISNGVPVATPVFDGAKMDEVDDYLKRSGCDHTAQSILTDGRTGEKFHRPVTVGYLYILKLHHLVEDKMHARSIGPYSLVTQQPLGGKSQFGGQRFGEMEVWALEAYGAAYTLQEMLTVKSDDVSGRTKVYESIVRGDNNFETGIPESFNVLTKEIRSLGLNFELKQKQSS